MNDLSFYVIIDNKSGKFLKKYNYRSQQYRLKTPENVNEKFLTDKLGRARIFESYATAKSAIPTWTIYNKDKNGLYDGVKEIKSWLEDGLVSIVKLYATPNEKRILKELGY